ncbi:MAG: hypothetical protein C4321_06635, partial [Chloroflexota bacterium]
LVFYYGLGVSSQSGLDINNPGILFPANYMLAVQGPRVLRAGTGTNGLARNPFTITAYINNWSQAPVTGSVTLNLPS